MKILIADTLSIIRDNVKHVLSSLPMEAQVDETYNGDDALSKIESGSYDLVILEDDVNGVKGLDVLEQTKNKRQTRVLIFTDQPEGKSAQRAFHLGASGYLTRFSAYNVLSLALHDIALGDGYEAHAS